MKLLVFRNRSRSCTVGLHVSVLFRPLVQYSRWCRLPLHGMSLAYTRRAPTHPLPAYLGPFPRCTLHKRHGPPIWILVRYIIKAHGSLRFVNASTDLLTAPCMLTLAEPGPKYDCCDFRSGLDPESNRCHLHGMSVKCLSACDLGDLGGSVRRGIPPSRRAADDPSCLFQ